MKIDAQMPCPACPYFLWQHCTTQILHHSYRAYRRLASLAAQQAGKTVSLRGKLLHGVIQALDLRANAPGLTPDWEPPEPSELLPWKQDSSILRNVVEVDDSTVKDPGGS